MPPPAVPCPSCGRTFFVSSLKIHEKQCVKKMAIMVVPCPACGIEVQQGALNDHMNFGCKVARLRVPVGSHKKPLSNSQIHRGPKSDGRTRCKPPLPIAQADAEGRVPCARCGRKFAPDRIAKHQFICSQLKRGPAKPPGEVSSKRLQPLARVGLQRSLAGSRELRHEASTFREFRAIVRDGPAPASRWRTQSMELRAAVRAARGSARPACGGGGFAGGISQHRGPVTESLQSARGGQARAKPARPTLAQRKHAAEYHAQASQWSGCIGRAKVCSTVPVTIAGGASAGRGIDRGFGSGSKFGGGSRFGRNSGLRGGGLGCGGIDMTSNRTSDDSPFFRGF
mmetsp:Transcript_69891/g.116073  ORF Transcript_69891/g.116073 Transcript_69891/m.116073 type:complete len:340 (-) Transcript_69891:119-1138(-)